MLLNQRDKREFKQNGFILLDNVIDDRLVVEAQRVIRESLCEDLDDFESLLDSDNPGQLANDIGGDYVLETSLASDVSMKEIVRQALPYAKELVGPKLITDLEATMPDTVLHNRGLNPIIKYPDRMDFQDPECVVRSASETKSSGHLDGYVNEECLRPWTIGITVLLNRIQPRGGGTLVWPGSHRIVEQYCESHSIHDFQGGVPAELDFGEPFEIAGSAGTLMLWHNKLLHSGGTNRSPNVRMMGFARLCREDIREIYEDAANDIWKYWDGMDDVFIDPH